MSHRINLRREVQTSLGQSSHDVGATIGNRVDVCADRVLVNSQVESDHASSWSDLHQFFDPTAEQPSSTTPLESSTISLVESVPRSAVGSENGSEKPTCVSDAIPGKTSPQRPIMFLMFGWIVDFPWVLAKSKNRPCYWSSSRTSFSFRIQLSTASPAVPCSSAALRFRIFAGEKILS